MSDQIRSSGALPSVHEDLGADLRPLDDGPEVPDRYADLEIEGEAIREGRALADRSWAPEAVFTGEDRTRFLDGLVTCPVPETSGEDASYGFFTDVKGRILSDGWISARSAAIHVELPPGRGEPIREHARRYRIADRVEISLRRPARLFLPGEDGSSLDLEPLPEEGDGRKIEAGGAPVWVERRSVWGIPGLVLTTERERGEELFEHLRTGRQPVGVAALERARIESGTPRFGRDFDSTNFPQETGLEQAVSYEKGCYLGQEVVARIHYRGAVKRRLRGLVIEGDESPPSGAEIRLDDRPLGHLTSVTRSAVLGVVVGLSILHDRGNDPGAEVAIGEGFRGRVVELPFA